MWDTHTPNPIFQCIYSKGPRPPISTVTSFVPYSAQNNGGKRHFLGEVRLGSEGGWSPGPPSSLARRAASLVALASETAASCKGSAGFSSSSSWGQRSWVLLHALLHGPELVHTVWPLDIPLAVVEAGKGPAPATGHPPRHGQFQLMSPLGKISPCSSYGSLGSSASSAFLGVSWSSLVTNMIRSFPSCPQYAMMQPDTPTSWRSWRRPHGWPLRRGATKLFLKNWIIIALQCCVSFCCRTVWISCVYTHIPSLWNLSPLHPPP